MPRGRERRRSGTKYGTPLPVETRYDLAVWSGLSWGVGEIRRADMTPAMPVGIRLSVAAESPPQASYFVPLVRTR